MSMENRFLQSTMRELRRSSWTETRDVSSRIPAELWKGLPSQAQRILAEFGYLMFSTRSTCLAVCPYNDVPAVPRTAHLDVDAEEILHCERVREAAALQIGRRLAIVGWEQHQDLQAIAVDDLGRVFALCWYQRESSGQLEVELNFCSAAFDPFLNWYVSPWDRAAHKLIKEGCSEHLSLTFTV